MESQLLTPEPALFTSMCRSLGLAGAPLLDLPLQNDLVNLDNDPQAFAERVSALLPLNHFAQLGEAAGFVQSGTALTCGELTISSTVHSALEIELGEHPFASLALPYAGNTTITIEGRERLMQPGATAIYMPGEAFSGRTNAYAGVMLNLPHQSLARTAQAIAGGEGAARHCRLTLQRPQLLANDTSLRAELLLNLRRLLSVYNGSALLGGSGIHSLALEDALQRLVILLLCPELLAETEADRVVARLGSTGRDRIFDELIEWIQTDLTRPLTLSQLERRSGYSRRSLQYMFRSRFGLGPMQWLRQQRLQAVCRRLREGVPGDTVGAIATRFGFISSSSFAKLFQISFGQTPSELLRASQRRSS
ncbi:helix-turn-helix domain-containing protein [Synechococcus sp. 1G10]|uniref:helix-turn-helix domain-containing protein n=1 Tax=Synechococcus sp. 1G10 TaxID=2025605 RepID=UPI000B9882F7|nr:AraC family transcriptional regulator [Synechococcus sp. 1G10]